MTLALLGGCQQPAATLLDCRMICDRDAHNAFTDLCRWRDEWWCCFREGKAHDKCIGGICVLRSKDGVGWVSKAILSDPGEDFRDPKLAITPDDRLMLTTGPQSRVTLLADPSEGFGPLHRTIPSGWLWRVTWVDNLGYGFSYAGPLDPLTLWRTTDGLHYEKVQQIVLSGRPCEATICPNRNDALSAQILVRRENLDRNSYIGIISLISGLPYGPSHLGPHIGGPNMIQTPDGRILVAGRIAEKTVLAELRDGKLYRLLTLPSGGDCGYPGMVWHDGVLWMSYYSSHEGKAKIYLAKVKL